eukprot:CAMPEP_0197034768 /NCGR_PEP_ID=MMETSP1384-20130603/12756_1 /TAXON_ID=29189 /ORGANISM="Ammonia sp." /LENGTH=191 /DNA_ID=CAMNT_0042464723 /DNA_START=12 /DNA_END=584 /DNA_ORIENTATION=+
MAFRLTQLVLVLTVSRILAQNCISDAPTDGTNAVQISFFSNPDGGELGDDCPFDCTAATPIKTSWYAIDQGDQHCYQWPGNSGQNSMNSGTCNTTLSSFTYNQWTNCECSGTPGAIKTVYTSKCTVDIPSSICQMLTDNTACDIPITFDSTVIDDDDISTTFYSTASDEESASYAQSGRLILLISAVIVMW